VSEANGREIVVENSKVRAVFSNRGAVIKSWVLKQFRDDAGEPLDLVPVGAGENATKPFTLTVDDQATSDRMKNAIYRVTVGDAPVAGSVDATASPQTITFETASADGFTVKKAFSFEPTSYVVGFTADVRSGTNQLNPIVHWGPGLSDDIAQAPPSSFFSPSYSAPAQTIYYQDADVERLDPAQSGAIEGSYRYAGIDDHYFTSIVMNEENRPLRVQYGQVTVPQVNNSSAVARYVDWSVRFQSPQPAMRFYFGPKVIEELRAIHPEYTRIINFGIFSWLAVPLLLALKWVHGFVGNWGWAIVVLTILINLAMWPLRHKSVVSMRKMQEIQPQMKAIQERYAKYKITDPERQKMNEEVMALYKSKGVNPASGCVPMLLTFPFLFAFYAMLSQAIEIRGAEFAGWITNLSAPDPLFITPILMGLAQFWQTRMTPTSADPTQQRIMLFMPIMFTMMSLSFPSGLVIYWFVSTIFTIAQQYFTNRFITPPAKAGVK
jgi:YidC/Oxa1 family membrane protein insertase